MSNLDDIINQVNRLSGYSLSTTTSSYSTIPTTGIVPGGVIKSNQILNIINALNGVNEDTIIISGSFLTSGSNVLDGTLSLPFINEGEYLYVTGGLVQGTNIINTATSSYALTASYVQLAQTASYALNSSNTTLLIAGDITAQVSTDPSSIFLIKSGSNTVFNLDSIGNITSSGSLTLETTGSYTNFMLIKNNGVEYTKVNGKGVLVLHQYSSPPTVVGGGMYFDNIGNFYIGL
jgi:hypothetical protein